METKTEVEKFGLERFEVAKLKNPHLIVGGGPGDDGDDDPVDTNHKNGGSSANCGG